MQATSDNSLECVITMTFMFHSVGKTT